jgi:hypothetical protein
MTASLSFFLGFVIKFLRSALRHRRPDNGNFKCLIQAIQECRLQAGSAPHERAA